MIRIHDLIIYILITSCLFNLSGCATIVAGTTQKVAVSSDPAGSAVQVDGKASYITPARIKLERRKDHVLEFLKEGYKKETVKISHVIGGAVCGNIILFGVLGWLADAITGAQYRLVPDKVHVVLQKLS